MADPLSEIPVGPLGLGGVARAHIGQRARSEEIAEETALKDRILFLFLRGGGQRWNVQALGVHPDKVQLLQTGPIRITGSDAQGESRVIELPHHPFFLGTLFVPQVRSTLGHPHPLVNAFLEVVANIITD